MLVISIYSVGEYERAKYIKDSIKSHNKTYNKQGKTIGTLSLKLYNTKKELETETKTKILYYSAGKNLLAVCKKMALKCQDIIENKKNCAYDASFLERPNEETNNNSNNDILINSLLRP